MTFPIFPKLWNGPTALGESRAQAQVPDLSHQTTFAGNTEVRKSGDFIDVYQKGDAGSFATLLARRGPKRLLSRSTAMDDSSPGSLDFQTRETMTVRASKSYRTNFHETVYTVDAHDSCDLVRLPGGELGAYTGATIAEFVGDRARITLSGGESFPRFQTLLSYNAYAVAGTPPFILCPFRHVIGSEYTEDGVRKSTFGFVTQSSPTQYVYVCMLDGVQREFPLLSTGGGITITEPAVGVRTSPTSIVVVAKQAGAGFEDNKRAQIQVSTNNGVSWKYVLGFEDYIEECKQALVLHERVYVDKQWFSADHELIIDTDVTTVTQVFAANLNYIVLPETDKTCLCLVDTTRSGGRDYSSTDEASLASTTFTSITGIAGYTTESRTGQIALTWREPRGPALFRIDLATATARKIRDVDIQLPDALVQDARYLYPVGVEISHYEAGLTPPLINDTAPLLTHIGTATANEVSGAGVSLRTEIYTTTSYVPPGFPDVPEVFLRGVPIQYISTSVSISGHTIKPTLIDLFRPMLGPRDAQAPFANQPSLGGTVRVKAMFGPEGTEYLIYAEESDGYETYLDDHGGATNISQNPTGSLTYNWGNGAQNAKAVRWVTKDFVTFERLPDMPWLQKNIGKRRWLDDSTILLPVCETLQVNTTVPAPNSGFQTYALYVSRDNERSWTRACTIESIDLGEAAAYNDFFDTDVGAGVTPAATLPRYASVEWFKLPSGKNASPNPFSGRWISDDRIAPPPTRI